MCGIISVASFDGTPVNRLVANQFEKQKHRGVEGFGVFDYQFKNLVRSTTEYGIRKWLYKKPSNNILFHHRFPTSTDNVKNACHPFSTKDFFRTNYVLVHNGHISNDQELKAEHEKLGIKYYSEQSDGSFNDSEALLWDLALYLEGKQDKLKATGGIAFVCLAIGKGNKHDKLYFGRNYNPLKMSYTDKVLMLSSEGEGESIETDTLYCYNYVRGELNSSELEIPTFKTYVKPAKPYTDNNWESLLDNIDGDNDGMTIVEAEALVKVSKNSAVAEQLDTRHLYGRAMWRAEGYYYEAVMHLEEEYDALVMLYDHYKGLGWDTGHIRYTMDCYESAVELIEKNEGYQGNSYCDTNYQTLNEEYQDEQTELV